MATAARSHYLRIFLGFLVSLTILSASNLFAQQCNDGIDNDGDGTVDALKFIDPNTDNQSFSYPDSHHIVHYINNFTYGRYFMPGGVIPNYDATTALGVCNILGWQRVVAYSDDYFRSCGDNGNAVWIPSVRNFDVRPACNFNKHLLSLLCAGRRPACDDWYDNDGDGLTDMSDPGCVHPYDTDERPHDAGCSNPGDNSEAEQCRDGLDNDGDGLTDLADPGCSSGGDDNEGDGTSQCQDGVDNDADGATDFPADVSCSSRQDNDETFPKAHCQDGIDNDGDGPADFPADFSCSSRQDTDEASPLAQCQDGIDNDGDGFIDLGDYSCSSNQDDDETNPKAQCQDGIDNDADGAIDVGSDFSCASTNDFDETNPKAQCQDGLDNDSDGAIDFPADFGCSSKQDNNESSPAAQCQDGSDNDGDGATDYPSDFSCSSKQDNDEGNPKAQCQDGSDNDGDSTIDLNDVGCASPQDNDEFNARTNIIPSINCVSIGANNTLIGTFGYRNDNSFTFNIAVGSGNQFSPTPIDRGQTTSFVTGLNSAAFRVTFPDTTTLSWLLDGTTVVASNQTELCADSKGCVLTPTVNTRSQLDQTALTLADTTKKLANQLAKLSSQQPRVVRDAAHAISKANAFLKDANSLAFKFPEVIKDCPVDTKPFCAQTDNKATIDGLSALYSRQFATIRRIAARTKFRQGQITRGTAAVAKARASYLAGVEALKTMPRFQTECK